MYQKIYPRCNYISNEHGIRPMILSVPTEAGKQHASIKPWNSQARHVLANVLEQRIGCHREIREVPQISTHGSIGERINCGGAGAALALRWECAAFRKNLHVGPVLDLPNKLNKKKSKYKV